MDLPTYTSIWRIEKRLYKLYDFRLPMPLPVGQIAVFAGIAVPYVILLTLFGLPFDHTLFWLYVLPPGVLTWLATRPVLESKRLPELIISQVRYLGEPRTWCRLAPLAEKDEVQVTARVWRRRGVPAADLAVEPPAPALQPLPQALPQAQLSLPQAQLSLPRPQPALSQVQQAHPAVHPAPHPPAEAAGTDSRPAREHLPRAGAAPRRRAGFPLPGPSPLPRPVRPPGSGRPAFTPPSPEHHPAPGPAAAAASAGATPVTRAPAPGHAVQPPGPALPPPDPMVQPSAPAVQPPGAAASAVTAGPGQQEPGPARPEPAAAAPARPPAGAAGRAPAEPPGQAAPGPVPPGGPVPGGPVPDGSALSEPVPEPRPAPRPVRVVSAGPASARPARQVERALSGPAAQRSTSWRDHVTVVPGGRGPGQADQVKRERARAAAALDRPRLAVVLGCTVGAGQTVTALMLADLLARLRPEPVAALDLNPGPASLAGQAQTPAVTTVAALLSGRDTARTAAHAGGRGRLDVIAAELPAEGGRPAAEDDHGRLYGILASRYPLVVVDPGAMAVARALATADQLILVAPASPDAARATAMTLEWLDGNGYAALISGAIAVMNGVSKRSALHAEQAEGVVRGRCRAIVRVPWDDHLGEPPAERGIRGLQAGPGGDSRLDQLRPPVLDAYTALAGVLISGLAAAPASGKAAP